MKKRIISLLLLVVMLISTMNLQAFAISSDYKGFALWTFATRVGWNADWAYNLPSSTFATSDKIYSDSNWSTTYESAKAYYSASTLFLKPGTYDLNLTEGGRLNYGTGWDLTVSNGGAYQYTTMQGSASITKKSFKYNDYSGPWYYIEISNAELGDVVKVNAYQSYYYLKFGNPQAKVYRDTTDVSGKTVSAYKGETFELTTKGFLDTNEEWAGTVKYSSSDKTKATVDSNGTVTILNNGTVTISANWTSNDGYFTASNNVKLNITDPPEVVESIEVLNYKDVYQKNDSFVNQGTIIAHLTNGSTKEIPLTSDKIIKGFDTSIMGTKTLTVSYEGCTTTYDINVIQTIESPEKPDTEKGQFRIYVPSFIQISVDANGNATYNPEQTFVYNGAEKAEDSIKVKNVSVDILNDWKLVDFDSDFKSMPTDSKYIGLRFDGVNVGLDGSVNIDPESWVIPGGDYGRRQFVLDIKVPKQSQATTLSRMLKVNFTADWYSEGGQESENPGIPHPHDLTYVKLLVKATTVEDTSEYEMLEAWYCNECDKYYNDSEGLNELVNVTIFEVYDQHTHNLIHVSEVRPTETTEGNIEYWYCEGCNKYYSDANADNEIEAESVIIPTLITYKDFQVTKDNRAKIGYTSDTTNLEIPTTFQDTDGTWYKVTSIEGSAFSGCKTLASVTIPDSVISIGRYAFWGCSSLTSVTIGNSVNSIGESAFLNCSSLTSVVIPDSVTSISAAAFYGCASLTLINVDPNNETYTSVDGVVFSKDIKTLIMYPAGREGAYIVPNSVTFISNCAFYGCTDLTSVTIPDSVTLIEEYAFYNCTGLTEVDIGNSVTTIGERAFKDCSGLTSITIPDSVTTIGNYAFEDCTSLESVTIADSVTSIGVRAFARCSNLTSITMPNGITEFAAGIFNECIKLTSVNIPNSVTSIRPNVFNTCTSLTLIEIPDSVTYIGNSAFSDCTNLELLKIPSSVTSIDDWAFYNVKLIEYSGNAVDWNNNNWGAKSRNR